MIANIAIHIFIELKKIYALNAITLAKHVHKLKSDVVHVMKKHIEYITMWILFVIVLKVMWKMKREIVILFVMIYVNH